MLLDSHLPLSPLNSLPPLQPLRIPPPPLYLNNFNLNFFAELPLPPPSYPPRNHGPWPGATALQQTCRELQTLIANNSSSSSNTNTNRIIRQPPPITATLTATLTATTNTTTTRPATLLSPIKFRTLPHSKGGRGGGADRVQKPSKTRKERMTARLLLRRDKNDDGKEGKGGKEEVDYEGIRDMFQTPVRSTVVVCDGVVVNPGSGREEGEGVRDGGYGDCDGDGAGLEEGMLGKDDEARVGMLLRRIRLGGPGGRKKTGRVGG